jgi:hypothetical protein
METGMTKFVITEETRKQMVTYLGEIPSKFSFDIISQLLALPQMENKPEDRKLIAIPKKKAKEKTKLKKKKV